MLSSVNFSARSIANNYALFSAGIAQSLMRLSSGKRYQNASEDVVAYTRSQNYQYQYRAYSAIKRDLDEWGTTLDVGSSAAEQVHDGLIRMKELWNLANQGTADEKDAYQDEFRQIAEDIDTTIRTTSYNAYALLNTTGTMAEVAVSLSTDSNDKLTIAPGQVIVESGGTTNLTALTNADISSTSGDFAGALTAVTTAIGDVGSYLSKLAASTRAVQSFGTIAASVMANSQSADSAISGINEAEEAVVYTQQEVRQQASLAMLAQANLSYRNVLILYGLNGD